ncbi:putative porin [Aureibaculum sp. A20]|uniref:Porin n=1 Tax=Aureibaculum flavum TaxID=2795986 RepID=A0ABS0WMJ6_9FLAO|nr:putative porin [Aureibaculum flavum]MBJ2173183.1 putative porin [Aureibaculum flavum]
MKKIISFLLLVLLPIFLSAQSNDTLKKFSFMGDFRFRIEQDWKSLNSSGVYRDDRTRLRYRARFGVSYKYNDWLSSGIRIRTGDPKKQQDPQLTLGDGFKEFGTLPIAIEKIYAKFNYKWFSAWVGKNAFPFEKQNELFWSDNVFPEGVALSGKFNFDNNFLTSLQINTGHFIVATQGKALESDSYFQGIQLVTSHWKNRIKIFPSYYKFNKMPNIPDGNETYLLDYSIVHLGANIKLVNHPKIMAGVDYYFNTKDYDKKDSIPKNLKNEKKGLVSNISIGNLAKKGDWKMQLTYTYLEKYAAVDFLSQNDWARWDYSSQGSPDGRLTNFKGLEIAGGYAIDKNINLKLRCFMVDQIIPTGNDKETGNRVRLDFNISF